MSYQPTDADSDGADSLPELVKSDSDSSDDDGEMKREPPRPPQPPPTQLQTTGGGKGKKDAELKGLDAAFKKQQIVQNRKKSKKQEEEEKKKKEKEDEDKRWNEVKEKDRIMRRKDRDDETLRDEEYASVLNDRKVIIDRITSYQKYVKNLCELREINTKSLGNGDSLNSLNSLRESIDEPLSELAKALRKGMEKYIVYKKGTQHLMKLRKNLYSSLNFNNEGDLSGKLVWNNLLNAHGAWGGVLDYMYQLELSPSKGPYQSWTAIKLDLEEQREKAELEDDVYRVLGEDELEELRETERSIPNQESTSSTVRRKAAATATGTPEKENDDPGDVVPGEHVNNVLISMHVLKWINKFENDPRVEMFKKRLKSLSEGRVSYCAQKTLKHHPKGIHLWEAKLTSGDRILYSKESAFFGEDDIEKQTLLIWYVCNHDSVPANIDKIDSSYKRRNYREIEFSTKDSDLNIISTNGDLLLVDPAGNNMLRTYSVCSHEITKLGSSTWKPPLQLTKHELDVVNMDSSVLLLGRGGTGKTYCLCSRMHRDATRTNDRVNALFISFTEKLKESVKKLYEKVCYQDTTIEHSSNLRYSTIKSMVKYLYDETADVEISNPLDPKIDFRQGEQQRVDYRVFEEVFWEENKTLCQKKYKGNDDRDEKNMMMTPLLAWTQIISFIKGSIEAVDSGTYITPEMHLAFDQKRVRLSKDGRQLSYKIFEMYQDWLKTNDKNYRWDQSDFVLVVYNKLKRYLYDGTGRLALYDKIYVDEVQDLTQAEIGLLLLSTKMNPRALFFAGDTAQSINHGVSFRFEEVRKAYHKLTNDSATLEKVQVLVTNFRSHDGILKVAGKVLDKLNETFKNAADRIAKNVGLAAGQRPYCHIPAENALNQVASTQEATTLVLNLIKHFPNLKILTWDHMVDQLTTTLIEARTAQDSDSRIPLAPIRVYGFKFVKGLEFESVVIVDFFQSETIRSQQKSWKHLFIPTGATPREFPPSNMEVDLKILYTAITRTRSKLFFVEREFSKGASACFRFFEGTEDEQGEALVEKVNCEFYKGDSTRSPLAMDHIWDGVELAEQASFSEDRDSDVAKALIQSLNTFCWAEKVGAFQKVEMLIRKATDEVLLYKFEEIVHKRRRLGTTTDVAAITNSDKSCLIPLENLDSPNEKFDGIIEFINESIDKVCGADNSVVGSKLCLMYLHHGMFSNARQIADEDTYKQKDVLPKLSNRIERLERRQI